MSHTLVLLRHGKSDWQVPVDDRDRPLADRGIRQAAEAGRWLAEHGPRLDLAWVSTARRAGETWDHAAAALVTPPPVRRREGAYTFDGERLLGLLQRLEDQSAVVVVGHNPAMEEAVQLLTGERVQMRTAAIAVIELATWNLGEEHAARLVAHGRPPLA